MTQPDTQTWTILRLLEWTRDFLARKGVEEPRLAAEILLAHSLDAQRIQLYTRFDQPVAGEPLAKFRDLVRRAADQEPIAYLVGHREFFSLPMKVTPDVLIPRPETETLVEAAIAHARRRVAPPETWQPPEPAEVDEPEDPTNGDSHAWQGDDAESPAEPAAPSLPPIRPKPQAELRFPGLRVLDMGTGSGCIAVALARHLPGATVIATDISSAALEIARENAAANGVQIDFREGPLLDPVAGEAAFDYICSNPPYVRSDELADLPANVRNYEPHTALVAGDDGLEVIRPLVAAAPDMLAPGGLLLIEVGYTQGSAVADLMAENAALDNVRTLRDTLGHERVVVATKKME